MKMTDNQNDVKLEKYGVVEMILSKKQTRNTTHYEVHYCQITLKAVYSFLLLNRLFGW